MRFGFKILGILLLAAFWLPGGGAHRGFQDNLPAQTLSAGGPQLSKTRHKASPVQFHSLRLAELKSSFGRNPEPGGPTELLDRLSLGASFAIAGEAPSRTSGFERTWQFFHRTALPVRAPCRAWEG